VKRRSCARVTKYCSCRSESAGRRCQGSIVIIVYTRRRISRGYRVINFISWANVCRVHRVTPLFSCWNR
jgi:hypothetical protein